MPGHDDRQIPPEDPPRLSTARQLPRPQQNENGPEWGRFGRARGLIGEVSMPVLVHASMEPRMRGEGPCSTGKVARPGPSSGIRPRGQAVVSRCHEGASTGDQVVAQRSGEPSGVRRARGHESRPAMFGWGCRTATIRALVRGRFPSAPHPAPASSVFSSQTHPAEGDHRLRRSPQGLQGERYCS